MKVAAYQAPLLAVGSRCAIDLIKERVRWCESAGVEILCCPEAILGGLADYASDPFDIAVERGQLDALLAPLHSRTVTTIVGFTEIAGDRIYNSAAIFRNGAVFGIYRKLHPAIRRSVYNAGDRIPVFTCGGLTFGILICNDSNFLEPAGIMATQGARALFIPSNNGLPPGRATADLVLHARNADIAQAITNKVAVIRADVSGRAGELTSHGSSSIIDAHGTVLAWAPPFTETLLVAEIQW